MSVLALVRTTPEANASAVLDMKQKLVDYWNAVSIINANAFAITKTQLTAIDDTEPVPAWWNTLSRNFQSCRDHAQVWIDTVYPSLTRVPQTIITYNTYFNVTTTSIINAMKAFSGRTPTPSEQLAIQTKLNLLLTQLGRAKTEISGVRRDVKNFTDSFAADRIALTTGSASVMEALAADREKVAAINAMIADLKSEIKTLQIALGIADVVGGVVMGIAYMTGGIPGLIIGIVGVGLSTAATWIILDKISDKNKAIDAHTAKLGLIARRTVSLNAIDASIQDLTANIDAINSCCEVVGKTWETYESDMSGLIARLTAARDNDWTDILQKGMDLGAAQEAWKNLDTFARDLQKVGMVYDPNPYRVRGAA